jgi:copper chaperone
VISFEVKGMSCGHCVKAVTEALRSVDPAAQVAVDLARARVEVESKADAARLREAIVEAGYEVPA